MERTRKDEQILVRFYLDNAITLDELCIYTGWDKTYATKRASSAGPCKRHKIPYTRRYYELTLDFNAGKILARDAAAELGVDISAFTYVARAFRISEKLTYRGFTFSPAEVRKTLADYENGVISEQDVGIKLVNIARSICRKCRLSYDPSFTVAPEVQAVVDRYVSGELVGSRQVAKELCVARGEAERILGKLGVLRNPSAGKSVSARSLSHRMSKDKNLQARLDKYAEDIAKIRR